MSARRVARRRHTTRGARLAALALAACSLRAWRHPPSRRAARWPRVGTSSASGRRGARSSSCSPAAVSAPPPRPRWRRPSTSVTAPLTLTDEAKPGTACPDYVRYATTSVALAAPLAGRAILGRPTAGSARGYAEHSSASAGAWSYRCRAWSDSLPPTRATHSRCMACASWPRAEPAGVASCG